MKLSKTLLEKYNKSVPRYTSYPPATFFEEKDVSSIYHKIIEQSNHCYPENIAFYIHIPFCQQICHYCGCNAKKLHKKSPVKPYINAIKKEISLVVSQLDKSRKISQIHFGGGTPNAIDSHYLKEIIEALSKDFEFIENPEIAIECHPALLTYDYLDELADAGFTRYSLGIQDFNDDILSLVNRLPSALPVEDIVAYLRNKPNTTGVNLDFIYGLPGQTVDGFAKSIEKAIAIRPDRLVTFSYAHLPKQIKHQRLVDEKQLPCAEVKMALFEKAGDMMLTAGYKPIGFDHFAKANDELSIALANKQLHRNFQGYCTRRTTGQVYAFGISGISQLEKGYFQNTKDINTYISQLESGQLPIFKSLFIDKEQNITKMVINQIMCNHYIHWESLAKELNINANDLKSTINYNVITLLDMQDDGLLIFNKDHIEVTEIGGMLIRNIASVFDPMYQPETFKYSQSV